jgi:hypothetical protein
MTGARVRSRLGPMKQTHLLSACSSRPLLNATDSRAVAARSPTAAVAPRPRRPSGHAPVFQSDGKSIGSSRQLTVPASRRNRAAARALPDDPRKVLGWRDPALIRGSPMAAKKGKGLDAAIMAARAWRRAARKLVNEPRRRSSRKQHAGRDVGALYEDDHGRVRSSPSAHMA